MNVNLELARQLAQSGERGVGVFLHDGSEKPLALDLHDVGHFRRQHVFGAGRLRLADHARGVVDIGGGRKPRAHLDHRGFEGGGGHAEALSPASKGSSLPASSSACSSSLPPTCTLPIKICGTVMPPFARSIISSRRSQSRPRSISVNSAPLRFSKALAAWQ